MGIVYVFTGKVADNTIEYINVVDTLVEVLSTNTYSLYTAQLWFVLALIGIYIFYPVIWLCIKNSKKIYVVYFALLSIFTLGMNSLQLIKELLEINGYNEWILSNIIWFIDKVDPVFSDEIWPLFYFMFGGLMRIYLKNLQKKKWNFIIVGALGMILCLIFALYMSKKTGTLYDMTFNCNSIFMPMFLIGLFAVCLDYKNKEKVWNKVISVISRNSFGIYLVSPMVISLIKFCCPFSFLLQYVLVAVISLIISTLLNKTKITGYLINI